MARSASGAVSLARSGAQAWPGLAHSPHQTARSGPAKAAHVTLGEECLRLNPADGTIASRVPAMTPAEARAVANRAALAFLPWSQCPGAERAAILRRAAALMTGEALRFGQLMHDEIGATLAWQRFNLTQAVWQLEAAAGLAETLADETLHDPEGRHFVFREPVGVCLGIAPWNAPLALGVRAIATALACGNSVVLKASEICAGTQLLMAQVLARAGLPPGVLNVVTHTPDQAEDVVRILIAHEAVRRVNFTGSSRVGRFVAGIAAQHLKRCLMELSGKAPLVVLADADLPAAADAAVYGAFLNQGQVCMSTDRVILTDAIADRFGALLAARAGALRAGPEAGSLQELDDGGSGSTLGPVVSEAMARRIQDLIEDACAKGAKLLCGGSRRGTFVDATVLDHVDPGMRIYHEECFGPVLAICRAGSEDEAISLANDSSFGLSAAIWSKDVPRAMQLARRIEAGICHINAPTLVDRPDMPVGGLKDSGYGRFGGVAALDEFTETRWVSIGHAGLDQRL